MNSPRQLEIIADATAQVFLRRIYEAGDADLTPMVYCPRSHAAVGIDRCKGCDRCLGLSIDRSSRATFLRCTFGENEAPGALSSAPHAGAFDPLGAQTEEEHNTVADIMSAPLRTVAEDVSIDEVAAFFMAHDISAAPVTNRDGSIQGVITKTDIVRRYDADHLGGHGGGATSTAAGATGATDVRARDLMTPVILALPTTAPITRAAALMAYEAVHHVLVHEDAGHPVGMLSALDVMGWLARRDGYVVPHGRRPRP